MTMDAMRGSLRVLAKNGHGRACPGHPRRPNRVDARANPTHDGNERLINGAPAAQVGAIVGRPGITP
jgi:hypothetical protein